jgi:hypothetical protein
VVFDWDLWIDLEIEAVAHGEGGRLGLAQQTIVKAGAVTEAVTVGVEGESGDQEKVDVGDVARRCTWGGL